MAPRFDKSLHRLYTQRRHLVPTPGGESPDPDAKWWDAGYVPGEAFACYATSSDQANCEKPFLGLYDQRALFWTGKPMKGQGNFGRAAPEQRTGLRQDHHST